MTAASFAIGAFITLQLVATGHSKYVRRFLKSVSSSLQSTGDRSMLDGASSYHQEHALQISSTSMRFRGSDAETAHKMQCNFDYDFALLH